MPVASCSEQPVTACAHLQGPSNLPNRRACSNARLLHRKQRTHKPFVDLSQHRCSRRRSTCSRALQSSESPGDEPVDIDQLAKRLSQEAEKARREEAQNDDLPGSLEGADLAAELTQRVKDTSGQSPAESSSPFGYEVSVYSLLAARPWSCARTLLCKAVEGIVCALHLVAYLQTAAREADILAEVGDGGFAAQEFELIEQIGQLSWVSIMAALQCCHKAEHTVATSDCCQAPAGCQQCVV